MRRNQKERKKRNLKDGNIEKRNEKNKENKMKNLVKKIRNKIIDTENRWRFFFNLIIDAHKKKTQNNRTKQIF